VSSFSPHGRSNEGRARNFFKRNYLTSVIIEIEISVKMHIDRLDFRKCLAKLPHSTKGQKYRRMNRS
jgi:hypothetical protein